MPDLPGGKVGEIFETGLEGLSSPIGIASALLVPVTGGASLGLTGAAGFGARVGTSLAAEAVVGGLAGNAAQQVNERLPEDTPGIIRLAASLGTGAVVGGGAGVAARRLTGASNLALDSATEAAAIRRNVTSPEAGEFAMALRRAERVPRAVRAASLKSQRQAQQATYVGTRNAAAAGGEITEAAARQGIAATSGKFKNLDFDLGDSIAPDLLGKLKDQAAKADLGVGQTRQAFTALESLFAGTLPAKTDLDVLAQIFGEGFVYAARKNGGTLDTLLSAIGAPRALVASADLSAPFRQGIMLIGHPKEFFGNTYHMARAFASDDYFNNLQLRLTGNYDEMVNAGFSTQQATRFAREAQRARDAGLHQTDTLIRPEEQFFGAIGAMSGSRADKVIGASERAYTSYLNLMRRNVFDKFADSLEATGNTTGLDEYAGFLNAATGRGPSGVLSGNLGKALNAGFFAPGYFTSRFVAPTYLWTATPEVRRQVMKDLGAFVGTGVATLSLLRVANEAGLIDGFSVETNPRSTDFGKAKFGNTRYDFWGGYQQIARNAIQIGTGTQKFSTGETGDINRAEALWRFGRSKLSPAGGIFFDALSEENFVGDEIDLAEPNSVVDNLLKERLLPLSTQDFEEGFREGGTPGAVGTIPALFGVGVSTYVSMSQLRDQLANELFNKESFDELTGAERRVLEQHPKIIEKAAEFENKAGLDFNGQIQDIENQFISSQQAFFARLATGLDAPDEFADALGEAQLRAATRRDQAARDFGLDPSAPTTPLAMALDGWYNLFTLADKGAEYGVETGSLDWDKFNELEREYLQSLTQEERDFVDARSRRDNAPEVEWFYNNKDYINSSGYYDLNDSLFDRYSARIQSVNPDITSYRQLEQAIFNAEVEGDRSTLIRLEPIYKRINSIRSDERERMRKRDPKLDAALWQNGITTTIKSRRAQQFTRQLGVDVSIE